MLRVSGQQGVPVITVNGQVVIGFDQRRLMQLLTQARSTTEEDVRRPRLGASIADAAGQTQSHPGIPSRGAFVGAVKAGSAAEQGGVRPGDVIIQIAGKPVASAEEVHRLVPELPIGRDVPLTYVRDGRERQTLVRL